MFFGGGKKTGVTSVARLSEKSNNCTQKRKGHKLTIPGFKKGKKLNMEWGEVVGMEVMVSGKWKYHRLQGEGCWVSLDVEERWITCWEQKGI